MPLIKVKLTLSLTVSLIFELALLTAEYKNDPKFFAPCVTFVVTKRIIKEKIKIRVRKKICYHLQWNAWNQVHFNQI